MYSHAHDCHASPSPEPAGTPGARCSACSWPTPRSRSAPSPPAPTPASGSASLQPHLVPLADRVLAETTVETLAGHDVVFLGAAARPVRPRSPQAAAATTPWSSTAAPTSGSPTRRSGRRSTAASTPASGPTACPSCRASATCSAAPAGSRCPAATRPSPRSRSLPALAAGLVEPDVTVVAASGTSGAGKAAKPHLLGSEVMGNASAYGVGGVAPAHPRDHPEPQPAVHGAPVGSASPRSSSRCRAASSPRVQAPLLDGRRPPTRSATPTTTAYADEPFVHLLPEGQWPQTKSVLGSNAVHLQVDGRRGRTTAGRRRCVDNLAKGTAGAAVQCMNLALGLDEATGLSTIGLAPMSRDRPSRARAVPRELSPSSGSAPGAEVPTWAESSSIFSITATAPRPRWCARRAACRRRPVQPRAVHRLRGQGAARLRADRRAPRPARRRWPTRRSASSPSRPSTPTGSSCPTDDAERAAEAWRRHGPRRRPLAVHRPDPGEKQS